MSLQPEYDPPSWESCVVYRISALRVLGCGVWISSSTRPLDSLVAGRAGKTLSFWERRPVWLEHFCKSSALPACSEVLFSQTPGDSVA